MADNVTLDPGSGGAVVATDDVGGTHYQIVKVAHGGADTATQTSTAAPLPVDLRADNLAGDIDVNINAQTADLTIADGGNVISVDDGGGSLTIDGTVSTELAAAAAASDSFANPTTPPVISMGMNWDPEDSDWVRNRGWVISVGNSTTATLGSGATFTGAGVDLTGYSTVTTQMDASHDSSTDGMTFQFSIDNTNWDDVYTFTYVASEGARRFQFPVTAQFFRFVYTNAIGPAQTHFRVQTILHPGNVQTSIHRLVDDTSPDRSATVVKSAIIAQKVGSGDFIPVQSDPNGKLKIQDDALDVVGGGVEASALRVTLASDSTGVLSIDDNGGSLTIDGSVTSLGEVAHDAADSGNPHKIGGVAHTAHPTAVANNDRVNIYADELGRLVTTKSPRDLTGHNRIVLSTTSETTLIAAGGAGVFRDLVNISVGNESGTAVRVDIRDSTAGTIRWSFPLAATGGGSNTVFNVPLKQNTANNNWTATLSSAVSSVYVQAIYQEES